MTETELAYLAGIMDGEGTISAMYQRSRTGRVPSLSARLSIGSTTPVLLDWVHDRCGGKIHEGRAPKAIAAVSKPYWSWVLLGRPAVDLAARLSPYLLIKREQAELLQLIPSLQVARTGRSADRVITPELLGQREALVAELRLLNRRGVA